MTFEFQTSDVFRDLTPWCCFAAKKEASGKSKKSKSLLLFTSISKIKRTALTRK